MDDSVAGQQDPRSTGKALTGPLLGGFLGALLGALLGAFWRYRVGVCRIIFDLQQEALRVLVVELGNRRDIYR